MLMWSQHGGPESFNRDTCCVFVLLNYSVVTYNNRMGFHSHLVLLYYIAKLIIYIDTNFLLVMIFLRCQSLSKTFATKCSYAFKLFLNNSIQVSQPIIYVLRETFQFIVFLTNYNECTVCSLHTWLLRQFNELQISMFVGRRLVTHRTAVKLSRKYGLQHKLFDNQCPLKTNFRWPKILAGFVKMNPSSLLQC